jgi:hypothetical protein
MPSTTDPSGWALVVMHSWASGVVLFDAIWVLVEGKPLGIRSAVASPLNPGTVEPQAATLTTAPSVVPPGKRQSDWSNGTNVLTFKTDQVTINSWSIPDAGWMWATLIKQIRTYLQQRKINDIRERSGKGDGCKSKSRGNKSVEVELHIEVVVVERTEGREDVDVELAS